MSQLHTLILLMTCAVILVGIALKWRFPYPIALVLGGALLGFIPGLGEIHFDPNLILSTVLPPTLYYAAYNIPFREFQHNIRDILWLALGLVIVTTLLIGLFFKWLFPEISWAMAFTFGAIISPPDATTATAILRRFSISSRLLAILEGESLINDATALVLYKLSLTALLSGMFSLTDAGIEFAKVSIGGLLVGAITGYFFHLFSSRFFDPVLAVVYSFTIPYLTFILSDVLQVSGALAVVINGLVGSRMLVTHFSSLTRVVGWASWDILIILLNCFIFILIGLQLYGVMQRLTLETTLLCIAYGILLTVATILVRFLCVYLRKGFTYFKVKRKILRQQYLHDAVILSWSGMRGIVSLAAALALPYSLPNGFLLPGRDIVVFLTFVIIMLTLLLPGFSLPYLLDWLKIRETIENQSTEKARKELVKAADEEIQQLYTKHHLDDEEYAFLVNYFTTRHQILEIASKAKHSSHAVEVARIKALHKQRQRLLDMWQKHQISDQLFGLLEHELDLEEAHRLRVEL